MTLYIYLKDVKKPLPFVITDKKKLDDFYSNLSTHDVIKFGNVIFRRERFLYCYTDERN